MKNKWICTAMLSVLLMIAAPISIEGQTTPSSSTSTSAMKNPAAVYCQDIMRYEYRTIVKSSSEQTGICILPDAEECDQWAFYAGQCGQDFSYCASQGYRTETRNDGQDHFAPEYAICIDANDQVLGSVTQLSELSDKVACSDPAQCPIQGIEGGEPLDDADVKATPDAPSSFDWRNYNGHNWITPVKNQASCGSCWAFAAVGVTEAHHNIIFSNPGLDLDLAEQDLVSCSGAGSCNGGWTISALQYIRDTGIVDEACFPYTALDVSCNRCPGWQTRLTFIDEIQGFVPDKPSIRERVVDYGPIYVSMGIGSDYGGYFDGNGVYRCTNDSSTNHAVVIVGYNNAGNYWIVKNSWGSSWNGDGYFKVGYDECAIDSTYAGYAYVIPPVTAHFLSGTQDKGWYVSDVAVTLTANELVQWTKYRLDGGSWQTYDGSFTMTTDGVHTLEYYSKDNFGAEEDANSTTVKIDQTAPDNPATINSGCSAQNNVWQNTCTDPTFTWSGADDHGGSGIKDYHVYWGTDPNGAPTTYAASPAFNADPISAPNGIATYYLRVATRDNLNHESDPVTIFILRYDVVAPTGSFTIEHGQPKTYDIHVDLQLIGQDAGSGLDAVQISNDQNTWTKIDYMPEIGWTILPLHRIRVPVYLRLEDKAGNASAKCVQSICLNLYPPPPSSDSFRLWSTGPIAGGQAATSPNFSLANTTGEPIAGGHLTSSSYQLQSGFQALWPATLGDALYTDWDCQTYVYLPLVIKGK